MKISQALTTKVYGDPTVLPQVESYFGTPIRWAPRACYDESKRCA